MRIGILGSGLMGGKLGTIFVHAGHEVVFSYSRSERKLKRLAREAMGHARAGTPREAALNADALLLAVHKEYRRRVPMLFPTLPRRLAATTAAEQAAARRGA
jgi:predicted dinucleotide-binding enzyme